MTKAVELLKDGAWIVPEDQRPANWREISTRESLPETPVSTAVIVQPPQTVQEAEPIAESFDHLPDMQRSLVEWCRGKVTEVSREEEELTEAYEQAMQNGWKSDTLLRHVNIAFKRLTYYRKVLAALEAGYCIFPQVDCEVFAIRVKESKDPKRRGEWVQYGGPNMEEKAQPLAAGEGKYVEPIPPSEGEISIRTQRNSKDEPYEVTGRFFKTTGEWDEVEFPLSMCKPQIMDTVGRAMFTKIFDEIGVFGAGSRRQAALKQDPVIVGRIINPTVPTFSPRRRLTFLLCWHVDTKAL